MTNTHLDQIIDYPSKIIQEISSNQKIIGLLVDNPIVDIINDDIDLIEHQIFDYDYVDDTCEDSLSYICIDTDITKILNDSIKEVTIAIYVISHKKNMKLNSSIFKGIKGNRRDNLVREIDLLMNGSRGFGIGKVQLTSVKRVGGFPKTFTGKVMIYTATDFNQDKSLLNE